MHSAIILIGPPKVGKTTIAKLLAAQLKLPLRSLDEFSTEDFERLGFNTQEWYVAYNQGGALATYRYMMRFNIRAIESFFGGGLNDCIVDTAPNDLVFEDIEFARLAGKIYQSYPNLFLLLPTADVEQNISLLQERTLARMKDWSKVNQFLLEHPSNFKLAKTIIYTKDKTPQQSRDELLAQLKPDDPTIVLIGPAATGKTTISKLVAEQLGKPYVSLDEIRWDYYREIGYSDVAERQITAEKGGLGQHEYWERFAAYAVERVLQDYGGAVLDFGGGHSVYVNTELFKRVEQALVAYSNIVLVLPTPDNTESLRILEERFIQRHADQLAMVEFFTRYFAVHPLTKQLIYTAQKSPEQVVSELRQLMNKVRQS
jgi:shikimate kinase